MRIGSALNALLCVKSIDRKKWSHQNRFSPPHQPLVAHRYMHKCILNFISKFFALVVLSMHFRFQLNAQARKHRTEIVFAYFTEHGAFKSSTFEYLKHLRSRLSPSARAVSKRAKLPIESSKLSLAFQYANDMAKWNEMQLMYVSHYCCTACLGEKLSNEVFMLLR